MRKPEPYDETINYEELLTRYLKYLYKEWISVPRNARKYPPMVGKDIQFSFQNEITIYGSDHCFITGDIYGCGIDVEENESRNMTFYKLFNKVLVYGVYVHTDTGLAIDHDWIHSFYKGTVRDLIRATAATQT